MDIPKRSFETAMELIDAKRKQLEAVETICDTADAIVGKFPDLRTTVTCSFDAGSINGVCIHVSELDDFRQVIPVCAEVIRAGHRAKGHEDFAEIRRRSYDYGEIKVLAFLKFNGAKCEFKQVGVKEEPVYELVCS